MIEPKDEVELAEAVAVARAPLAVRGGGTRGLDFGRGDPLSVAGLTGVTLYEPGALTVVARAGTPVAELDTLLAAEGQRLAFEPPDMRGLLGRDGASTIGGVVAANASGPRRVQVGAARDFALGVRFVDGTGAVVKNGGRVMKNVTGYDLVKLMAGSRGTLGILSEVSLKVLPRPESMATLAVECGVEGAAAVLAAALGSPFDVSGAAWADGRALVRVEGFAASVAYRRDRLADLLGGFGAVTDGGDPWAGIRDVEAFHDRSGAVWRIAARPSDAVEILARIEPEATVMDWGGGLIWVLVPESLDVRARAGSYAGHAMQVRGPGATAHLPEPPAIAALTAGLRARFDPRGLFSPEAMR